MPKFLEFEILDVGAFLVFGVPNPKYLTFGTLDGNALSTRLCFFLRDITYKILIFFINHISKDNYIHLMEMLANILICSSM